MTSEPPQNEIDSSTPTRLQNTTNEVVSCAYVRISARHEPAVPRPASLRRGEVPARRRRHVDRGSAPRRARAAAASTRCQKSSHTARPTPTPEPRRHRAQHVARREEPPLVEQPVRRQEDLAVDVAELAVLEQRRGDEQPVVAPTPRRTRRPRTGPARRRARARRGAGRRGASRPRRRGPGAGSPVRPSSGNTTRPAPPSRASSSSSWWRARLSSRSPRRGATWARAIAERLHARESTRNGSRPSASRTACSTPRASAYDDAGTRC